MITDTAEGYGAVLYDNTPGGAGHVRELLELERKWLEAALNALYLNEDHDRKCETACLDCLLTFDAQEAMSSGLLRRREAHITLGRLLAGEHPPPLHVETAAVDEVLGKASQLSNQERITRTRGRRPIR